jgi:hypothetical protein
MMDEAQFERLIRIETKIDGFLLTYTDHESRIRKLEKALYLASGFAATAGGSIGALLSHLMGG